MVIFIKRRRGLTSKENNHYRVDEKGRLYVGGIYAGFEDDSFKLFHPSSLQPLHSKQIFLSRQVNFWQVINLKQNLIFRNSSSTIFKLKSYKCLSQKRSIEKLFLVSCFKEK